MADSENFAFTEDEKSSIQNASYVGYAFEDIPIEITAILGTADIDISNLLKIGRGAVIELNRLISEPIELLCQGRKIGHGEVVIGDNNRLSVSITQMGGKQIDED